MLLSIIYLYIVIVCHYCYVWCCWHYYSRYYCYYVILDIIVNIIIIIIIIIVITIRITVQTRLLTKVGAELAKGPINGPGLTIVRVGELVPWAHFIAVEHQGPLRCWRRWVRGKRGSNQRAEARASFASVPENSEGILHFDGN